MSWKAISLCLLLVLFGGAASANSGKPKARSTHDTLKGSRDAVRTENKMIEIQDLTRIENEEQRQRFIKAGLLVRVRTNSGIMWDPSVPARQRYVRPETAKFLWDLGVKYRLTFPNTKKFKPLHITSGTRTIEEQNKLRRHNPNAISPTGPLGSSHPSGATVDLGRSRLKWEQNQWLGFYLASLEKARHVQATEEHGRPCDHVMVYRSYLTTPKVDFPHPPPTPQKRPARKSRRAFFLKP